MKYWLPMRNCECPTLSSCSLPRSLSQSSTAAVVGTSDPKACLRCSDLHLSFGSSLDCVFPVVGCFKGDLQLSWAVALCQLRHPLMLFPWDFCAHSSIRVRVEVMGMQELLLTGSVLSRPAHVGPNSCAGGGKQEQEAAEGCGSPGPEQTASSPQGLCLCRGPYGAVFHSRPRAMRFGSDGG